MCHGRRRYCDLYRCAAVLCLCDCLLLFFFVLCLCFVTMSLCDMVFGENMDTYVIVMLHCVSK